MSVYCLAAKKRFACIFCYCRELVGWTLVKSLKLVVNFKKLKRGETGHESKVFAS